MRTNNISKFDNVLSYRDFLRGGGICLLVGGGYLLNISHVLVNSISIVLFGFYYFSLYKRVRFNDYLIMVLIISLPFSYISLIGGGFFSLFTLCQALFILNYCFSRSVVYSNYNKIKLLSLLIIILSLAVYIRAQAVYEKLEVEEIIKTELFLLTIFFVSYKGALPRAKVLGMMKIYVYIGCIHGLFVIVQFIAFRYYGLTNLGNQARMGLKRVGFSGLFFDYSIASVYLASVATILFYNMIRNLLRINKVYNILCLLFVLVACVVTSARSGIVAFFVTAVIILFYSKSFRLLFYSSILSIPLIKMLLSFFEETRTSQLTNSSGRIDNYLDALKYFETRPILGAQFLGYNQTSNNMLAHNFVLDFFVQYGLLFSILLLLLLVAIFKKGYKFSPFAFFSGLTMIIGANFHASFLNTHYIVIPLIIILSSFNYYGNISDNKSIKPRWS